MTPKDMALLHRRCFLTPPPWSEKSFVELMQSPFVFLRHDAQGRAFVLGRVIAGEAELLTIATSPEAQRQGLGMQMLHEFDAAAQTMGATTAFLEVAETNLAARRLYAKAGFQDAGRRKAYYVGEDGAPIDALILCKSFA